MRRMFVMLRCRTSDVGTRRRGDVVNNPCSRFRPVALSPCLTVFLLLGLLFATGCRRDMQDQPKMKPFRGTTFFGDGLSARPPVEGTIPRGYLRTDTALYTGKKNKALASVSALLTPAWPQPTTPP